MKIISAGSFGSVIIFEGDRIMPNVVAVIMAAGKGSRMKSKLPKVLHTLAGKTLIEHILDTVNQIGIERPLVVVGHERDEIAALIGGRATLVVQEEQLGTGHAVRQAVPHLRDDQIVLVLSGDQPLLKAETLRALIDFHEERKVSASVLTAHLDNPYGYGRVMKDGTSVLKIVEERDASFAQKQTREINTGTYCFEALVLKEALEMITPQNAQGEYYLTEAIDIIIRNGEKVLAYPASDPQEAFGINSRGQLAEAEAVLRRRILEHWMEEGVTILDPVSTFIGAQAELARDVTIFPFTQIMGKTRIGEDALIGPQTSLEDCSVGRGTEIAYSVAKEAAIGENCHIGPFAYLRPGTELAENVKVGDFVEVKNSKIGQGAKVPHLSYIGDALIGKAANIGAGTITCNYDGKNKHLTKIGDHAFIGSNTNLVAPVEVGEHAVTGAGSTITKDVPAKALAVERNRQIMKENWQK